MTVNSIYESLYKVKDVKEIILAVDSKKSWRSLYFPRYKEARRKQRDKKTDVNWEELFSVMHNFFNELRTHLPFKVIKVRNSEADDVIAVLCLDIIKDHKHVISNDEDFLQLCSFDVTLYNPSKQQEVVCKDPEKFIIEKSLTGQAKDGIFNVKTPSDWGLTEDTNNKKKPGFGPAALKKVMEYGWKKWLKDNDLQNNFRRNRVLMDFNLIPISIRSNIRKAYETYEMPDPNNIYTFFKKNGFTGFLEDFTNVERKLMELY
jgi:5'-3' exonuclease